MNAKKIVIVIPMHRATLKWNEDISLRRCAELFKDYHVALVFPEGMDISGYKKYGVIKNYIGIDAKYFTTDLMYNKLMLMPFFYKPFLDYDYMLIYQLDTFVFENNLPEWCDKGYDYIGAPWIDADWINKLNKKFPLAEKFINKVGNGGLSLRKIKKFYYGSIFLRPLALLWKPKAHEDFFWTSIAARLIPGFKIPSVKTALEFAFEESPQRCFELNGNKLPFGCHAWEKFGTDFWKPHFAKYGYSF